MFLWVGDWQLGFELIRFGNSNCFHIFSINHLKWLKLCSTEGSGYKASLELTGFYVCSYRSRNFLLCMLVYIAQTFFSAEGFAFLFLTGFCQFMAKLFIRLTEKVLNKRTTKNGAFLSYLCSNLHHRDICVAALSPIQHLYWTEQQLQRKIERLEMMRFCQS